VFSFLEILIEVDCGKGRRPLSKVAESRWILLANIFSAHGVPIGEESVRLQVIGEASANRLAEASPLWRYEQNHSPATLVM
jgi:hypothetical protein